MSAWSDVARERAEARRKWMLGEARQAVIQILEEERLKKFGKVLLKDTIAEKAEKRVVENRKEGVATKIPLIENTVVREAKKKFILHNWSIIVLAAARDKPPRFIVSKSGRNGGVRLGTLEEFEKCQGPLADITKGVAKYHNKRSDIIVDHGGEARYIATQLGTADESEDE
jgi:hypothetical protein